MTNSQLADHLEHCEKTSWGEACGYEWISREEQLGSLFRRYLPDILKALRHE